MVAPSTLAAVAIGGAAGALLRFGIGQFVQHRAGSGFPFGTLTANLIGCLLLGFCSVWLAQRAGPALRTGINVGFIGALTTFSTYCLESLNLVGEKQTAAAMVNLIGSVVAGLICAYLGMVLARSLFGTAG